MMFWFTYQTLPNHLRSLCQFQGITGPAWDIDQISKVLNSHYSPPQNVRSKYKIDLDKKTIKYLGINLSMDLISLEEINYSPL